MVKKKHRKKRPDPKVESINVIPMPGARLTEEQIDISRKLIEYAEAHNRRIDTIIFPIGG